jgi:hypothetical protein
MKRNILPEPAHYLFFALAVLILVPLTAGLLIWADFSIQNGNLGIGVGSIIVIVCLYATYILLNAGIFVNEKSGKATRWVFTMAATVPAAVTGIGIGLTTSSIFLRVGLVITAALLGIAFERYLDSMLQGLDSTRFYKIDMVRQGVVMLIVGAMSVIYVSMPVLLINISH